MGDTYLNTAILPKNMAEWAAFELAWGHGPEYDIYDLLSGDSGWDADDYDKGEAVRMAVFKWINQNIDWLIQGQLMTVLDQPEFGYRFYANRIIRSTGTVYVILYELRTAIGTEENRIKKYFIS